MMMQLTIGLFRFPNSVSVPELLVEDWDVGRRDRRRDGLNVCVNIGQLLVAHYFASVGRHVAGAGIADVGSKCRKRQFRLGQAWAGEPALSDRTVTLITAVAHEKAFAV